ADWCIIDLLEPDGSLRRAALAARDADLAARIEPLRDHPAIRGTGRASERAVAGREVVFLPDVGEASRRDKRFDPGLRELIVAIGGDEARRALDAGTVATGLVDEPEGSLELLSIVGADRSAAAEAALAAVIASGEAIWIDDFGVDDTANDLGHANRSGCAVPL